MLRSICGPAWFWDTEKNDWMIPTGDEYHIRKSLCFALDEGMDLLSTVNKKT